MEMPVIDDLDGQQCADVLVSLVAGERAATARTLRVIAQWAVLHDAETVHQPRDASGHVLPGTEQAKQIGGDGTPLVAEFAIHELASLLGLPFLTCRNTFADVLDLVHRHPLLWARLEETAHCDDAGVDPAMAVGLPQAWQALKVARACRNAGLSLEAARWVDAKIAKDLGVLAWARCETKLAARILQADPTLADQRRKSSEGTKRVSVSQTNEAGMKTLTVQLPAAQIIWLKARLHQIATLLKAQGATDTINELEADAAFLLANPAHALQLLLWGATPHQPEPGTANDPADSADEAAAAADPSSETDEPAVGHHEPDEPTAHGEADHTDVRDEDADDGDADDPATTTTTDGGPEPTGPTGSGGEGFDRFDDSVLDLFDDRRVHPREGGDTGHHGTAGQQLVDPFDDPILGSTRMEQALRRHDAREHEPPDPETAPDPHDPGHPSAHYPPDQPERSSPPDLVPEADIHPAQRDENCPSCGLDPTRGSQENSASTTTPAHPAGPVDPAKLQPKAVLYLHGHASDFTNGLDAILQIENGTPVTTHEAISDILGHSHVTIRPVIDLHQQTPTDAYEIPADLREALQLLHPYTVTPFSTTSSRGQDGDHTQAYTPGTEGEPAEPDQTRLDNLAPLGRSSHRYKTFAPGVTLAQPVLGVLLWRTRHGYSYQVDNTGTHPLGRLTATEFHTRVTELADPDTDHLDPDDEVTDPALDAALQRLMDNRVG